VSRQRSRSSRRSFACALVFALSIFFGFGLGRAEAAITGSIAGTVRDDASGAPLRNVAITAKSPGQVYRAVSDDRGAFTIVGIVPDSYTVAFERQGYEGYSIQGLTVLADSTAQADARLSRQLRTIGRVQSRSASSAYQPNQTEDSYTINAQTQDTLLGKQFNTSQNDLLKRLPSVTEDNTGTVFIRGGTSFQTGLQFEGIDYTEPNRTLQNKLSNIGNFGLLNGLGSLQLIPGGGDASHGNTGTGLISLLSKRGTYPGSITLDLEAGSFPYYHQLGLGWGTADAAGRVSNYLSFEGVREDFQYGQRGVPGNQLGIFIDNNTLLSPRGQNLVGVSTTAGNQASNDIVDNFVYKFGKNLAQYLQIFYQNQDVRQGDSYSGYQGTYYASKPYVESYPQLFAGQVAQSAIDKIFPLYPGQYTGVQLVPQEDAIYSPFAAYKLEYGNNLSTKTYFDVRWARTFSDQSQLLPSIGLYTPDNGGDRSTFSSDLTYQLDARNLLQIGGKYEFVKPFGTSTDVVDYTYPYFGQSTLASGGVPFAVPFADFLPSAACQGGSPGYVSVNGPSQTYSVPCGYLSQYFPKGVPRLPPEVDVPVTSQQVYGLYVQDTARMGSKLRGQFGLRLDGYNFLTPGDAADGPSIPTVPHQRLFAPHAGLTFTATPRDSFRATYGRTLSIPLPGLGGNAIDRSAYAAFAGVPSFDNTSGALPTSPGEYPAKYCGLQANQTCATYADQLYWLNRDAKYGTNALTSPVRGATFTNYDATYSRQFGSGVAFSLTPFFRRGYDVVEQSNQIVAVNPATGALTIGPSLESNLGVQKTTGVELNVTRESAFGFSGVFNATYINQLGNDPPTNYLAPASLALGALYRSPYFSPFQATLAVNYKSRSGWRVTPALDFNAGYPYGNGAYIQVYENGVPVTIVNSSLLTSQVNNTPFCYVDPQNPGTVKNPVCAAFDGVGETAVAGGLLSHPQLTTNLTIEFAPPGKHLVYGVAFTNLMNQLYGVPYPNPNFKPIATGFGDSVSQGLYAAGSSATSPFLLLPNRPPFNARLYLQVQP
jgi:hypothetical protein